MNPKWLVSYPLDAGVGAKLSRETGESDRDFARRLVGNKEYARARSVYDRLLLHTPNEVTLWTNRSVCGFKLRDFNQSARDAQRAALLDPANVKAWFRCAAALKEMGKTSQCLKCLDEALALDAQNSAALSLKQDVEAEPVAWSASQEIYGSLQAELPLSETLLLKIFSLCEDADLKRLRLVCSLFNHLAWKAAPREKELLACKPWRLAHRVPHLERLTVLVRHTKVFDDFSVFCAETLQNQPLAALFPHLQQLKLQPTLRGFKNSEILLIVDALHQGEPFENAGAMEEFLGAAGPSLDLLPLGNFPAKARLVLLNMFPPLNVASNLFSLRIEGSFKRVGDKQLRVLRKVNLIELELCSDMEHESFLGQQVGGGEISSEGLEHLPPTLERLQLANLSGVEFPFPKPLAAAGLKELHVKSLRFMKNHVKNLPPKLKRLTLDLSLLEENSDRKFRHESYSLMGLPKTLEELRVVAPRKEHHKLGVFEWTHREALPAGCVYRVFEEIETMGL